MRKFSALFFLVLLSSCASEESRTIGHLDTKRRNLSLLQLHLPEGLGTFAHERQMYAEISELLSTMQHVLGEDALSMRLFDLAESNPLTPGRVPMLLSSYKNNAPPPHPHIMLAGLPYTGIVVGNPDPSGDLEMLLQTTVHELSHALLGKFNDGLTESFANLLKESPMFGMSPMRDHTPLLPAEWQALGVLSVWEDNRELMGMRKLQDIFSMHPRFRTAYCRFSREHPEQVESFAAFLLGHNYQDLMGDYRAIEARSISDYDSNIITSWLDKNMLGIGAAGRLNPNESRGYVRDVYGHIGDSLTLYLLSISHKDTPKAARRSLQDLLSFYFSPDEESLEAFGFSSFEDLQRGFHTSLLNRAEAFLSAHRESFARLVASLQDDPCLAPDHWSSSDCQPSRDNDPPLNRFLRSLGSQAMIDYSGPRYHPVVAAAKLAEEQAIDFALNERLGPLDYCQLP